MNQSIVTGLASNIWKTYIRASWVNTFQDYIFQLKGKCLILLSNFKANTALVEKRAVLLLRFPPY